MWYTMKVGPDVTNVAKELIVHISHPVTKHWKALGFFIGYINDKETKVITVRKPKVIEVVMFCDSNYVTIKKTRNVVNGLVNWNNTTNMFFKDPYHDDTK